ncbi:hypothetical protein F5H01DRAFT_146141 [Linnemannia elongata]|nr:hypothetical protein F5H01DRAFT_146141 [Linnemannia elongata]
MIELNEKNMSSVRKTCCSLCFVHFLLLHPVFFLSLSLCSHLVIMRWAKITFSFPLFHFFSSFLSSFLPFTFYFSTLFSLALSLSPSSLSPIQAHPYFLPPHSSLVPFY